MLLGRHPAEPGPFLLCRTLQGLLSGLGFLGGAVIFKSGKVESVPRPSYFAPDEVKTCVSKAVEVVV